VVLQYLLICIYGGTGVINLQLRPSFVYPLSHSIHSLYPPQRHIPRQQDHISNDPVTRSAIPPPQNRYPNNKNKSFTDARRGLITPISSPTTPRPPSIIAKYRHERRLTDNWLDGSPRFQSMNTVFPCQRRKSE